MLDYIISLKPILLTYIMGGISGYLLSCLIDNFLFDEQVKTVDNSYKRAINIILWCMAIAFGYSLTFISAAAFDYLLNEDPTSKGIFMENDSIIIAFIASFLVGISNTLVRICELTFSVYKKNKI